MALPRLSTVQSADAHRRITTTVNQLIDTSEKFQGLLSVKGFGAKGDSDATATTGTDDTAAIQSALDYLGNLGGGTLFFPRGYYKISSYLTIPKYVTIIGEGKNASVILGTHAGGGGSTGAENLRNGSIFYCTHTINGSTITYTTIRDITAGSVNASNVGAAFYDSAGSVINVTNCNFGGTKYGVVLEQSELADIDLVDFEGMRAGGAGVWIVNGATLTPGAGSGFTNRISVTRCQFNVTGSYGILDDGGVSHTFADNNYNAPSVNHIRAAGVFPLAIRGGEYEGASGDCIAFATLNSAGASVGGCIASIHGGSFNVVAGHAAIAGIGTASGALQVDGFPLFSGGGGTAPITGAFSFIALYLYSYSNQSGHPAAVADGQASFYHIDLFDGGVINRGNPFGINGVTFASSKVQIGGAYVLGAQQAAIGNDASGAANQATVNAILAALRAHGLIAT